MDVCLDQNNELITTDSIARQRTEIQVENVNTEEEIDFDDLTITGDYSDYDILEEEKGLYPKMMKFGSKLKKRYEEGGYY